MNHGKLPDWESSWRKMNIPVHKYQISTFEHFSIPEAERDFLVQIGLPETASP